MRRSGMLGMVVLLAGAFTLVSRENKADPQLKNSFRRPEKNGWIYVHLEGSPAEIGYQHGYWLAPEIADARQVLALSLEHDTKKDWTFWRDAARNVLWPKVEQEYREELQGIADGLNAHGVKLDLWDVVAINGWLEFTPYYFDWWKKQQGASARLAITPERCSAFVATGSYTRDGKPVIGHNAWTGYMEGERWRIIFDIVPRKGYRILMDGFPGFIDSGDDFGVNSAGIMITETTISQFFGFDPNGIPEFVRARKAMQYSASIDDFVRIMKEGNNGGYANNWLVADGNTNEIADLELGLKNVTLLRTKDGYYAGSNFPLSEKLAREETDFNLKDPSLSPNARRVRWDQLMKEHRGRIDVAAGQKFLADHFDAYENKPTAPNERTLCGHIDLSPRGMKPWQAEFGAAGAVQNKVTSAAMAARMAFTAAMGHACGLDFKAAQHLREHPEFAWEKEYLHDLKAYPWTEFSSARSK